MRDINDKKGGGLMMIVDELDDIAMDRFTSNCRDVLGVRMEMGSFHFAMILVYLDMRDAVRNAKIYEEIDRIMAEIPEGVGKLVVGDFNGHVGFLGDQEVNGNGTMILDFMER